MHVCLFGEDGFNVWCVSCWQTLQKQLSLELRRKLELCGRLLDCADYMLDPCGRTQTHSHSQVAGLLEEALLQWPDSCPLSLLRPLLG